MTSLLLVAQDRALLDTIFAAMEPDREKVALVVADNGRLALTRLEAAPYEAVLIDSALRDMKVLALMAEIKAVRPDTPVLLTFEDREQDLALQALARHAYEVIQKPCDPALLIATIRRAFKAGRLSREAGESQMHAGSAEAEQRATEALSAVQDELAAQLADVSRLHELSARLSSGLELKTVLDEVLAGVTALQAADKGELMFYEHEQEDLYTAASIGLSPEYLKRVGRIPLGVGASGLAAKERRPVIIVDLEKDPISTPHRQAARLGNYRAVYATPLIARTGELIGTIATYFRQPHRPSTREIRLVELYARQAVEVIDNARLHQATQEATARAERYAAQLRGVTQAALALNSARALHETLDVVTEQSRGIIGAHQAVTSLITNNNWTQAMSAISLSEKYAVAYRKEEVKPDGSGLYSVVCQGNRPVRLTQRELEAHPAWRGFVKEVDRHPPMRGWLAVPLIGRDGRNIGLIQLSDKYEGDFSEQDQDILVQLAQMASVNLENARLFAEAQDAERRVAFLAEAGAVLARSLDLEITLRNVAQLAIPHLADWCFVDLVTEEGSLQRMAVAYADPSRAELGRKLRQRDPIDLHAAFGSSKVMRTGWPEMFHEIGEPLLVALARTDEDLEILRQLNIQSCICAPLQARGRTLGVMTFLIAGSSRRYGPDDLTLTREVARRAALAVDHAALYQQAKEAIRRKDESLALLDTLLGTAPIGFAFVDRDLRYVRINDSLAGMNGLSREEHLGRRIGEVLPRLASVFEPLFRRVLATGEPVVGEEISGETAAMPGQRRDWLASCYPVRIPSGQTLGIGVVVTEITDRKRSEEQIRTSLQEKEVLLKEIHHRVKNNLQIISSLLRLQSDNPQDKQPPEILQESQNRIRSMALIHEKLYTSPDISKIDFTEYIRTLAASLFISYRVDSDAVRLHVRADQMLVEVDAAIPCGLILNELVSNALKYAFPNGREGEIRIDLHSDQEMVTFGVSDNGIGFPINLDFRNTPSLGLQLVTTLVDQLRGTIELARIGGTEFKITFPLRSV
jgi:PAS domain S-box-containing protein